MCGNHGPTGLVVIVRGIVSILNAPVAKHELSILFRKITNFWKFPFRANSIAVDMEQFCLAQSVTSVADNAYTQIHHAV